MNNSNTIHETVIRDVLDVMKDGISAVGDITGVGKSTKSVSRSSSLTKATSGLTLVYPVFCTDNVSIETATMLTKYIEAKATSLLQIAFSAYDISTSDDALAFVKQFHTNLGNKVSLDEFIDAMDSFTNENELLPMDKKRLVNEVLSDMRNIHTVFQDNINEESIARFVVKESNNNTLVTEAKYRRTISGVDSFGNGFSDTRFSDKPVYPPNDTPITMTQQDIEDERNNREVDKLKQDQSQFDASMTQRADQFEKDLGIKKDSLKQKTLSDEAKQALAVYNAKRSAAKDMLLDSDVKKANEAAPTMMVVNFHTPSEKTSTVISRSIVIGVKAKIYSLNSEQTIGKLVSKKVDANTFLKLVKVSTREISFVKDFLFAIDNAKLAALGNSQRKGSQTQRMLKLLERRALKGKVRKALNSNNMYKAISTLVLSIDEINVLKQYGVDLYNIKEARRLLEDLNFMCLGIVDEVNEVSNVLYDTGDDTYETIAFTNMERQSADGSYKKAINLMAKTIR